MTGNLAIRTRLTLLYSTVLAICLVAFGAMLWFSLRESLVSSKQEELEVRATSLRAVLSEQSSDRNASEGSLREELIEFGSALPSDFSVEVRDLGGPSLFRTKSTPRNRSVEQIETVQAGGRSYQIKMAMSLEPVDQILLRLSRILLFSIPFAVLAASLGGLWLGKRALKPVTEMAFAAKAIGSGDLSSRLPVPASRDELSLLAQMWNEMLGRLEASVGRIRRFTSDASHDLRTPLATIRAAAEIALRRTRDPEDYQLTLESIIRQTDRASSLVEDLLVLARADSGEPGMCFTVLDLAPVASEACATLRPLAQAKKIDLRLLAPTGPVWVKGNKDALARVALALIDNAIKNTDEGTIEVLVKGDGRSGTLIVRDPGRGIDAEDLPHIFDRFYRGDKSRNIAGGGFGLGLAIAKETITLHQGTIDVESELGKGSRFVVSLPLPLAAT